MSADLDRDAGRGEYSDAGSFARLAERFESLRALPAAQRDAAIASLAVADPELTTALRRLFAQHDDDPERLGAPERAFAPQLLAEAIAAAGTPPPMPAAIGPYRPIRELGRGGMGTVYLAERQHADFRQQVAIKLLRADAADRDLHRRFRTERRILAALQHPNIATMFDGGTTDDGQAFVVIEYVDGTDLLTHCDGRRLALAQRLRLFVKVCRAVAHAHRALVVHRDLKPGNVLVTADGEPKLLDFGIAKLLQREPTDDDLPVTRTGSVLLTPEYGSPEQVRGGAITTATDIHALGTILYELLCDARAQPLRNRSLAELIAVICDRSPPPPSAVVLAAVGPLPGHPESRARLARQLHGDLDTIVACALRKEPERRYASATALADDVERQLAGLPVAARGDTFGYRTRKFVRRQRLPLAAAMLLVSLLAVFAIVTAAQNRQVTQQRDVAVTQRVVADHMVEFLVDLFEMAAPDPQRGETLRAVELLDRGARRIDTELAGAPQQQTPLQLAMGRAYLSLGQYDRCRPLLEAAERALAASALGSRDHRLAQFYLGVLAMHEAQVEAGERLMRLSLQPTEDGAAPDPVEHGIRCLALASWLRDAGRFDDALELIEAAERVAGDRAGEIASDGLDLAASRAVVLRERGDFAAALAILQAALQRAVARDGEGHPRHGALHAELGRVHKELGNLDEARAAMQRSLELARAVSGDAHPDVDASLFSLAMLEIDLGELTRAETLLREILGRDETRFGARHPYPALVRGQLAMVLGTLDQPEEAETLFREALAVQREQLPADHPELATTLGNLGTFLHRRRRYDEAAAPFTEALQLRERIFPAEHPAVLTSRSQLAVLDIERGRFAEAEQQFRTILEVRQRVLGSHAQTAGSLLNLASAIAKQNRHAEAITVFEQSLAMFRATVPATHPTLARPLLGLGIAHLRLQQPALAEPHLHEAVEIYLAAFGERHPETWQAQWTLARCVAQAGRTADAIAAMRALLARITESQPGHRLVADVREALATLLEQTGDAAGAAAVRRK